jgi:cytochrome P450
MPAFRGRLRGERASALAQAIDLLEGWMLFHDGAEHLRLRAPLRREFTPAAVSTLESTIRSVADSLLDELADAESFDLVPAFAHALPAAVIAKLFGLPAHLAGWLASWSEKFGVVVFGATNRDDYNDVAREAGAEFHRHIGALLDERRADPSDDLISTLLRTEDRPDGLSAIEILGACSLLLFAGHDTTSSFIAAATSALLDRPDSFERFDAESPTAIEELLRFEPPAKVMMRQVAVDHERGGQALVAGDAVFMGILAANRDRRVFDQPDELDFERDPNPHLTFGFGNHFCLGAALARLEARLALGALFARFPHLRRAGATVWRPTISDRSPSSVPISIR